MEFVGHVLLVGVIFLVLDAIWLSIVANAFYKKQLGGLLRDKPDFVPAVLFYVLYVIGMVVFALNPALGRESVSICCCSCCAPRTGYVCHVRPDKSVDTQKLAMENHCR